MPNYVPEPSIIKEYTNEAVVVLLKALITAKVSLEHDYLAEMLSVDGMRHPLLRKIPCEPKPGTNEYAISAADFITLRSSILDGE